MVFHQRIFLFFLAYVSWFPSSAQYNKPYRIAWDGNNYYVTNKGNGTLSKLDASFRNSTARTGLYSPNDVFFANVAGNSMIAIIDSNAIKLFDSTSLSLVLSIPIQGATEAHDGAVNPLNNNEFFISDRAGNRIIKGSIGAAPFYPVTFSTINSSILRPSGLIFDRNNRLLIVCDTTDGEIYRINTSTGAASLVKKTGINHLNDIAQDAQGNYYVSNWDDSYIYRYDPNFDSAVSLTRFNKPAGLYANTKDDYLVIACMDCNKLDFLAFHMLIPEGDLISCAGDSIAAYIDRAYKGIGTYSVGNRFQVVLSDSTGDFTQSTVIGSHFDVSIPDSINCYLPGNFKGSANYRYRIEATQPRIMGALSKQFELIQSPEAFIFSGKQAVVCNGTDLVLGKDPLDHVSYLWNATEPLNQTDQSFVNFRTNKPGTYPIHLSVRDTLSGCGDTNSISISVVSQPELNIADTLRACEKSLVELGQTGLPWKYHWSSPDTLNQFAEKVKFTMGPGPLIITLELSDSSGICRNEQIFVVLGDTLPTLPIITGAHDEVCRGETFSLKPFNTLYTHLFRSSLTFTDSSETGVICDTRTTQKAMWEVTLIDEQTGCRDSLSNQININPKPDSVVVFRDDVRQQYTFVVYGDTLPIHYWLLNGIRVSGITRILPFDMLKAGDSIQVIAADEQTKCSSYSEVVVHQIFSALDKGKRKTLLVYPNPAASKLLLELEQPNALLGMYDQKGILIQTFYIPETRHEIDIKNLRSGLYRMMLNWDDGTHSSAVFMKE